MCWRTASDAASGSLPQTASTSSECRVGESPGCGWRITQNQIDASACVRSIASSSAGQRAHCAIRECSFWWTVR
jgi:hypothetical protein